jgi:hypothetical protein
MGATKARPRSKPKASGAGGALSGSRPHRMARGGYDEIEALLRAPRKPPIKKNASRQHSVRYGR